MENLDFKEIQGKAQNNLNEINNYILRYEQTAANMDYFQKKGKNINSFKMAVLQLQGEINQGKIKEDRVEYYSTFIKAFEEAANFISENSLSRNKELKKEEQFNVLRDGAKLIHQIQTQVYKIDIPYMVSYISKENGEKVLKSAKVNAEVFFNEFFPENSTATSGLSLSPSKRTQTIISEGVKPIKDHGEIIKEGIGEGLEIESIDPETQEVFRLFYDAVYKFRKDFWPDAHSDYYINQGNLVEAFYFVSELITSQYKNEFKNNEFIREAIIKQVMERTLSNTIKGLDIGDVFIGGISTQLKNINASVFSAPQILSELMNLANNLKRIISGGQGEYKKQLREKIKTQIQAEMGDIKVTEELKQTIELMLKEFSLYSS